MQLSHIETGMVLPSSSSGLCLAEPRVEAACASFATPYYPGYNGMYSTYFIQECQENPLSIWAQSMGVEYAPVAADQRPWESCGVVHAKGAS